MKTTLKSLKSLEHLQIVKHNEMKVIKILLKTIKYGCTKIGVFHHLVNIKKHQLFHINFVTSPNNELTNGLRYFHLSNAFDKIIKPMDLMQLEAALYEYLMEQLSYCGIFGNMNGVVNEDRMEIGSTEFPKTEFS